MRRSISAYSRGRAGETSGREDFQANKASPTQEEFAWREFCSTANCRRGRVKLKWSLLGFLPKNLNPKLDS
jgi:hypothetical protein